MHAGKSTAIYGVEKCVRTSLTNFNISDPIAEERIDYDVHLRYVQIIARLSRKLSAKSTVKPIITAIDLRDLQPKLRLVQRTRDSLSSEIECIHEDFEYAHAWVAWLPAKVYYNLYHLLSIIEYMLRIHVEW